MEIACRLQLEGRTVKEALGFPKSEKRDDMTRINSGGRFPR
jgi:hypothetical protein